ncbi:complement decay-accelerating factor isoform X3 [Myxocyprinus asiaticus]|uniref:complement decay-accelerating factor isoform X3 n=1 Tax=Myxocyprinus asiaticus TaxID=70543 RepID=UPI0022236F41|nr:complement decay-accelerating factor isoform X3 [Myxocyprinus asiaticus]
MTSVKTWQLLLLPFALVSVGKADCPLPVLGGKYVLTSESTQKNNFPENSEASLECPNGHLKDSGSNVITCRGGKWSDVELICKKRDCGTPKPSPHMTYSISDGTLFGAYARPICERGYFLEGSSHRQCLVTGWGGKHKCIRITCEPPVKIEHGKIMTYKESPELDDVIEYSCNANYILIGNKSLTCGEDGEYDSPPPTCEEIQTHTTASITTNIATSIGTTALHLDEIQTQTTASITTNIATSIATIALSVYDIKIQTTEKITTNTDTTNSSVYERNEELPATYSQSSVIIIGSCFGAICLVCLVGSFWVCLFSKQKGSYNTGEEQRTKEELCLYKSL